MGKSYGTFLGTLYVQFFPEKVGRVVLDGAVDPTISDFQQSLSQAIGFDRAFAAFATDCSKQNACPLPRNKNAAIEFMKQLFIQAEKKPIATKSNNRILSESLMVLGTASALYDSATGWPDLRTAIAEAKIGEGGTFLKLADEYIGRLEDGSYQSNEFDSAAIIDCLDFKDKRSIEDMKKDVQEFNKLAPLFGPYLAHSGLGCKYFAVPKTTQIQATRTANRIVIIGTTGDPATPYQWAQGLNKILTNSVLISLTGEGHTGQGQGNTCVDLNVDRYLISGSTKSSKVICD
jgi:pimeloyl-ACP methyl ester carboxylesterase